MIAIASLRCRMAHTHTPLSHVRLRFLSQAVSPKVRGTIDEYKPRRYDARCSELFGQYFFLMYCQAHSILRN